MLTNEQYKEIMTILEETAAPEQQQPQWSDEIRSFETLADVEVIRMNAGETDFTVYRCSAKDRIVQSPIMVNIHGGGWYIPHKENDLYFSCWLAAQMKGVVLSVDYTTSDKQPWKVMFAQCYEAARYASQQAKAWGCDPQRLTVGGYSAGGHLTAGVVLKAMQTKDFKISRQIICYAPLNMELAGGGQTAAENEFEKRIRRRGQCFMDLLFRREQELYENSYANPWKAADDELSVLPETLIITAGRCGFHDEDEAYALRLAAQGVETTVIRYPEANHGFIPHFGEFWQLAAGVMVKHMIQNVIIEEVTA